MMFVLLWRQTLTAIDFTPEQPADTNRAAETIVFKLIKLFAITLGADH